MIWKTYNSKRFSVLLAGLSAFCLALWPLSGSGETYPQYLNRIEALWEDNTPVWCWSTPPPPQTYWNSTYCVLCAWSDARGSYVSTQSPLRSSFLNYDVIGSCATNFPVSGSVFPCLFDCTWGYGTGFPVERWKPIWLLDPSFPVGSAVPFGSTSFSGGYWTGDPSSSFSQYIYSSSNLYSGSILSGRAYVLPQRVFVTNGWNYGTNSLLWDMYGDGRMFLPRFVVESGFLCQQNVLDFDPSLWEQLHFRGEYTSSKTVQCTPFSWLDFWNVTPNLTSALWFDGVTRPLNTHNQSISLVVTNQGLFGTNMLSPSQFPYIYELFGLPSAGSSTADASWRYMRYIPESIQHGDFGVALLEYRPDWSPSEWAEFGKGGIRGLCFAPVSRLNGAVLRFSRFVLQPIPRRYSSQGFARLTIYVPSGLAWDNDGGCCFNWSKDGQPLSSLFKWPLTSSWDYSYTIDIYTNGVAYSLPPYASTHTNINSRVPGKEPSPPDNAPPLPPPPRGGTISGGGGGGGGGTTFLPFNPSGQSFTFTSGIILDSSTTSGGSGGRDTPIASSSLTYQNEYTPLAIDDNGDLLGEFNLHLPTYSDFYTLEDIEDRNSLQFKIAHDLAVEGGFLDDAALWDWAPAGPSEGEFAGVLNEWAGVAYVDGSGPQTEGFADLFDTSGEWWYEHLPMEPIFPRVNTLVLPWPEHTAEGWDWTAQRTFELPEEFASYRPLLLWVFGVGLSLMFIALTMALFSRGAN